MSKLERETEVRAALAFRHSQLAKGALWLLDILPDDFGKNSGERKKFQRLKQDAAKYREAVEQLQALKKGDA